MRFLFFILSCAMGLSYSFFSPFLHAAQEKSPLKAGYKHDSTAPLEITSEQMIVDQKKNQVVFKGNVHATQSKMELFSHVMKAYYHTKHNEGDHDPDIYKIEVEGDVRIDTPKEKATGDKGFYLVKEEKLELEGHVVLNKEDTLITGDKLTYYAKTGESSVTSAKGSEDASRVRAVFVPKKKKIQKEENIKE